MYQTNKIPTSFSLTNAIQFSPDPDTCSFILKFIMPSTLKKPASTSHLAVTCAAWENLQKYIAGEAIIIDGTTLNLAAVVAAS